MIEEIYSLLKADAELAALLGGTPTQPNIYPVYTEYLGDCIIYNHHVIQDNGAKLMSKLEISAVAESVNKIEQIEKRIRILLVTPDDRPLTSVILQIEQNGGGNLYDEERNKHHRLLYFTIIHRRQNKWQII